MSDVINDLISSSDSHLRNKEKLPTSKHLQVASLGGAASLSITKESKIELEIFRDMFLTHGELPPELLQEDLTQCGPLVAFFVLMKSKRTKSYFGNTHVGDVVGEIRKQYHSKNGKKWFLSDIASFLQNEKISLLTPDFSIENMIKSLKNGKSVIIKKNVVGVGKTGFGLHYICFVKEGGSYFKYDPLFGVSKISLNKIKSYHSTEKWYVEVN